MKPSFFSYTFTTATNPGYAYFLYYLGQVFPPLASVVQSHGLLSLPVVLAGPFFNLLWEHTGDGRVSQPWSQTDEDGQQFSYSPTEWFNLANRDHAFDSPNLPSLIGELTNSILQALGISTSYNWESFLAEELAGRHPEDIDRDIVDLLNPKPTRKRKRGGAIGWLPTLNSFFTAITKGNTGQRRHGKSPTKKALSTISRNLKKQVANDLSTTTKKKKKTSSGKSSGKTCKKEEGCCCINIYCKGTNSKLYSC